MIKALISDFSRVILFPKEKNYNGTLNALHKELSKDGNYNVLDYFELNTELLEFYKTLKGNVSLHIFTSDIIQDASELQPFLTPVFDNIFSASNLNINKKDPVAYKTIITNFDIDAEEVLYIDDSSENIEAAKKVGLRTIQYTNNRETIAKIRTVVKLG